MIVDFKVEIANYSECGPSFSYSCKLDMDKLIDVVDIANNVFSGLENVKDLVYYYVAAYANNSSFPDSSHLGGPEDASNSFSEVEEFYVDRTVEDMDLQVEDELKTQIRGVVAQALFKTSEFIRLAS